MDNKVLTFNEKNDHVILVRRKAQRDDPPSEGGAVQAKSAIPLKEETLWDAATVALLMIVSALVFGLGFSYGYHISNEHYTAQLTQNHIERGITPTPAQMREARK